MENAELVEYIQKNFSVDQNGTIHRSDRKGKVGYHDKDGYLIIKVKRSAMKAHRIAYIVAHGEMPKGVIDHINGIRDDNRIENLRCVSQAGNVANTRKSKNPQTGEYGIYEDRCTPGLKKKYCFHFSGKMHRAYTPSEARELKKRLWEEKYGVSCETIQNTRRAQVQ